MADPSTETNGLAAKLAGCFKALRQPLGMAITMNLSPTGFRNRLHPKKVSALWAESGPQLIGQTAHPAGMLVEIMVSQALTVVLAGLVVAAILH